MSKYLIVVPITDSYKAEGEALLRSLLVHNPTIPVHVIGRNGEVDYLKDKFSNVDRVINEVPDLTKQNPEFRQIRTSRFRHAADMAAEGFTSVLILDADMLSIRPLQAIFKMAESGIILVCSNNTLYRYTYEHFSAMHIEAPKDISVVHASFSTVPMFINVQKEINRTYLYSIANSYTGNDLDVPNFLVHIIKDNDGVSLYDGYIYHLNSYNWTNIHHSMEKELNKLIYTDQGYFSNQGDFCYFLHGHLWDTKENGYSGAYHDQLIEPMERNYGYYPPYIECAKNVVSIMENEYKRYFKPIIKG